MLLQFSVICLSFFSLTCGVKVTIIGGGMAGIAAARYLLDNRTDIDVVVLEAHPERYGGRILTVPIPGYEGQMVEYGAMWLHEYGDPNQPIRVYCEQHNIETIRNDYSETNVEAFIGNATNVLASANYMPELQATFELHAELGKIANVSEHENQTDTSIREEFVSVSSNLHKVMLDLSPIMQHFLVLSIDDEEGTKLANLSATTGFVSPTTADSEVAAEREGSDQVVPKGYLTVVDSIVNTGARRVPIRLNADVSRIRLKYDQVSATTSAGSTYYSDYAIVALPLGVLQARTIRWNPELPKAKQDAIQRMGFGNFVKALLTFDKQFWPTDKDFIFYFPQNENNSFLEAFNTELPRVYFVSLMPVNNVTGLVAILSGSYADYADSLSDYQLRFKLLAVLKKIHGEAIERLQPKVMYFSRTRWSADPLVRGAYSYGKKGMHSTDPATINEPIGNRIFFAGEYTRYDDGDAASVHGAFKSGIRAAQEIISQL